MKAWAPWCALGLAISTSCLAAEAGGKKGEASATPAVAVANAVSLRIWKDSFATKKAIRVLVQPKGRKGGGLDLHLPGDGYRFNEYVELPVGNVTVNVTEEENPKAKLVALPLTLLPGSYSTLLIRERAGRIVTEVVDDTPPDAELNIAELTVRNFVTDLGRLQIRFDDDTSLRLSSPESFVHIRGLERKALHIETSGTQISGKAVQWTTEIDFKTNRKATLLIYPDSYGRVRPRVTIDGESSAAAPAEDPQ